MSGGRSLTSSGQPAMIVSTSWFSTASCDVSLLTLFSRSVEKRTRSTRKSRSMVVTLSGLGNRDKPSASWFCEPGRYVIVKLYPCNWINIRCSLGGADAMGLLAIITRGRWSVMTLNSRPYKYVWNRCIPNTIDKSSRSIQAYRCSVGVGLLLAYAMGLSSPPASGCRSAAPIPLKLASHCRYAGLRGSK